LEKVLKEEQAMTSAMTPRSYLERMELKLAKTPTRNWIAVLAYLMRVSR